MKTKFPTSTPELTQSHFIFGIAENPIFISGNIHATPNPRGY
jgi:hypothetical protein